MSKNELIAKIEALNAWEALMEEAKAEADAIRDSIKQEMLDRDVEELTAGAYIIRWTSVLSNRFDTTGFKKVYGDLYKAFTKQTSSRRFSISSLTVSFSFRLGTTTSVRPSRWHHRRKVLVTRR